MFLILTTISFFLTIISEFLKDPLSLPKNKYLFLYVLNIISTSFLASSIFYYIQSYRPKKIIEKNSYLSIEPYLIKLNYDLQIFTLWIQGYYSFDESGELKSKNPSITDISIESLVIAPNVIKPLFKQIKNKIICIKTTGLSDNLDFELNKNLNNILIFIEDELSIKLYSNKFLDSIYFGTFADKSKVIIETHIFLDKYIKDKTKEYKK